MKSGQILILVLLVVVVVLAIGLSVASRNITNLRTATQSEQSQRAFGAAEGGVEKVLSDFGYKISVVAVTKDEHHRARGFLGNSEIISKNERDILLANSEAHRFAIKFHKQKRRKEFNQK